MGVPTGVTADPQWRSERARKAARARFGPDSLIRSLANMAETLTDEQRAALAAILATPRRAE